jgi:hypothetical protein
MNISQIEILRHYLLSIRFGWCAWVSSASAKVAPGTLLASRGPRHNHVFMMRLSYLSPNLGLAVELIVRKTKHVIFVI